MSGKIIACIVFSLVLSLLPKTWAQSLSSQDSLHINSHSMYLQDANTQSWQQALKHNSWQPGAAASENFGLDAQPIWVKYQFYFADAHHRVFEVRYPPMDYVDLYLIQNGALLSHQQQGDLRPHSQQALNSRNYTFELHGQAGQSYTLLFKFNTLGTMTFPILSSSYTNYAARYAQKHTYMGIYMGLGLSLLIYNLILFVYIRDKTYLYYCLFVTAVLLNTLAYTGYGFSWLWPNLPQLNQFMIPVTVALGFLTASLFTYSYLQIPQQKIWLQYCLRACFITSILAIIISLVADYATAVSALSLGQYILTSLILVCSIYLWRRGQPEARFFTIAWLAFLAGTTINASRVLGLIDSNSFTEYAGIIGNALELLLLSLGLAHRIDTMRHREVQLSQNLSRAQEDAIHNLQKYKSLFNQPPIGLFQLDRNSHQLRLNRYLQQKFSTETFVQMLSRQLSRSEFKQLLQHGNLTHKQIEIGEQLYELRLEANFTARGKVVEVNGVMLDISDRIKAQKLQKRIEQNKLDSLKQVVIGLSHEFNTPLGIIITANGVADNAINKLQQQITSGRPSIKAVNNAISELKDSNQLTLSNTDKLSHAIAELKLTMLDSRQLEKTSIALEPLIADTFRNIGDNRPALTLNSKVTHIRCVPHILADIFCRLFENSMQHAFADACTPQIQIDIHQDQQGALHCLYQDNGRGLSELEHNNLFVPFYSGQTKKQGNSGLGMYIIHTLIVNVLKGSVSLEQTEQGFALLFCLPDTLAK